VLGRLPADSLLGGSLRLDADAARAAVARLAAQLGLGVEETALGILRIVNEHMARALRVIALKRGADPRRFTLFPFGGAGGLHVCALAEALDMREALVPVHAGVLSALGMLAAPRGRRLSRTVGLLLRDGDAAALEAGFAALERQGREALRQEGVAVQGICCERSVDLRYRGQSAALTLAWQGAQAIERVFHEHHQAHYGHRLDLPVELVNLRVRVVGPTPVLPLPDAAREAEAAPRHTRLYGIDVPVPVWRRTQLRPGEILSGPALIVDPASTTYLAPSWHGHRDRLGNLVLRRP
jgi:N-methylhydantoinase A